jgi:outer membrane lipoprotein SlyB
MPQSDFAVYDQTVPSQLGAEALKLLLRRQFHRAATFFGYQVSARPPRKGIPATVMIERSIMCRLFRTSPAISAAAMLACIVATGCAPNYSPDTYASVAAQQANKVDQGIIVGVRAIQISADTTLATATGGAAGGVAGSTVGAGAGSALSAVGGTMAGAVVGNVVGHAQGDTGGFEYIVKKPNGDLLSVTQQDSAPLGVGAHVLIIEGAQARVVPDYTVPVVVEDLHPEAAKPAIAAAPAVPAATPAVSAPAIAPPVTAAAVAAPSLVPQPASGDQKPAAAPDAETPPPAKPADMPAAKPASGG